MKALKPLVFVISLILLCVVFALIRDIPDTATAPSRDFSVSGGAQNSGGAETAGGPGIGSPSASGPGTGSPSASGPNTGGPNTGGPSAGSPSASSPNTSGPGIGGPNTGGPSASGPAAAGNGGLTDSGAPNAGAPATPGASGAETPGTRPGAAADDYTEVQIDDYFLHKGSLLLINNDYRFEPPAYPDRVPAADFKTSSYRLADAKMELSYSIMAPLNEMMDAFYAESGLDTVTIVSAYRDYDKQQSVLNEYIALVGPTEALKWASRPGHSEHHSGMAFDLGVYSGGAVRPFTGTGAYAWFKENSYKFGFIVRYPSDKTEITGIANEPWHFRYVGDIHAYLINSNGWCLEEYIEFVRGYSPFDSYLVQPDTDVYEIFFTRDSAFDLRKGCMHTISGDNIDGYIITVRWPQGS